MSTRPAMWSAFRRAASPAARSRVTNTAGASPASRTRVMAVAPAPFASIHSPDPPARALEEQRNEDDDEDEVRFREHGAVADIGTVAVFAEDEARHRVG